MSYQVIARKYRPQTFDEVVGQPLVTQTLKNAIEQNRVAHGYIFSGARGVGKTTTARIFAKALNCIQGPTITPCGVCPSCVEITAGNALDVLEIDAASNRGIDEIRELRDTVRYLPARDRNKVFIIDEVHMLTTEAFNALLKTLEEPPSRSLFILATTEPHKLPATIQSRCQHFSFRLLDYAEIYGQLERLAASEKITASEPALGAIAEAAEGSLRDALSLLDQMIAACGDALDEARVRQLLGVVPAKFMSDVIRAVQAADARGVLELVNQLAGEGYDLGHFCSQLSRTLRNLMIAKSCGAATVLLQVSNDERRALAELAQGSSPEDLSRFFQILLRTQSEMRYSLQPRFHLELGLMKLVHAQKLAPLESLLAEIGGARGVEKARASTLYPAGHAPTRPPTATAAQTPARTAVPSVPAAAPATSITPEARPAIGPAPSSPAQTVATGEVLLAAALPASASGAADPRLAAIKSLLFAQSKRFVSSCLEHVSGWRFENGEVRFSYPPDGSVYADLLKSREQAEALRAACTEVLGQPVKIYVTLDQSTNPAASAHPSARERAAKDRGVESFVKRFDCTLVDAKDLSQE